MLISKAKRWFLFAAVFASVSILPLTANAVERYEVLVYGDKDSDDDNYVLKLQEELYARGYMETEPTGYFGKETQQAVIRYQERRGIEADGKVGPATQKVIYGKHYEEIPESRKVNNKRESSGDDKDSKKEDSKSSKKSKDKKEDSKEKKSSSSDVDSLRLGDEGKKVEKIQKRLKELGYYNYRKTTNYYGTITEDAVEAFQKANKLTDDGVVGKRTERLLFSSDAKKYKKSSSSSREKESTSGAKKLRKQTVEGKTKADKVVNLAKSLRGSSYRTGGSGPNTFDCSGLIYYVLKTIGVSTPRSSGEMSRYSSWPKVDKSDLKKGDIVFFTSPGNPNGVGHAGIYLGGGDFIHSSSGKAKGVTVSNLSSGGYKERYQWARRPFK